MVNNKNSLILSFVLFGSFYAIPYAHGQKPFVIAHMTNSKGSVRWALDNGAAGVELDLNFDRCGNPTEFKHGGVCDCSCLCLNGNSCDKESVCRQLWDETGSHCGARINAAEMFDFLGTVGIMERLSVVYIDSKLNNEIIEYYQAGANVVKLINQKMFDRGYKGQVVISGLEFKYLSYLQGALDAAKSSSYGDKYFYTFDGEGKDSNKVWNGLLQLGTPNIVFATGITICLPTRFDDAIKASVAKGKYAGIGIWTLDKKSSMEDYLKMGVTAIVTNIPTGAVEAITPSKILKQGDQALFPQATAPARDSNFSWSCDCNYHKGKSFLYGGGCSIMTPPPPGQACKCKYAGGWTCRGNNVGCKDSSSPTCKSPDMSKSTCDFGGGDCKGYQC